MVGHNWLEKYVPDLLSQKITLEDVRKKRQQELGIPVKLGSTKRAFNNLGYSIKQIVVGENSAKAKPCRDCGYYYTGICITPKQAFKGWQDKFDQGYCPLK